MTQRTVFVLRHESELDGYDTLKILGVYSNMTLAEEEQKRFSPEPGFREHPEGFAIEECKVDRDLWSGGFTTYYLPDQSR